MARITLRTGTRMRLWSHDPEADEKAAGFLLLVIAIAGSAAVIAKAVGWLA